MDLREEIFYKDLDEILLSVHKQCTKLDKETTKENVKILDETISKVISLMKKDELFDNMYKNNEYVGSYYENLRVKEANEFDLNVVMKLPLDYSKIMVENVDTKPGFVKVKIDGAFDEKKITPCNMKIKKWMDLDGYLNQDRVYNWMWSVAARAYGGTNEFHIMQEKGLQPFKVSMKKSGPAITFNIKNIELGKKIDVDVVFALQFPGTIKPPISGEVSSDLSWAVIPKAGQYWRLTFYNNEKVILGGKYNLKYIAKLLKSLRDAKNLNLPSYYIKTLFLLKAEKENFEVEFWKKREGYLFMVMLLEWYQALSNKRLPFYWQKETNLLIDYTPNELDNRKCYLERIIIKINKLIESKDKERLRSYLYDQFIDKVLQVKEKCAEKELFTVDISNSLSPQKILTQKSCENKKCEEEKVPNFETKETISSAVLSTPKLLTQKSCETVQNIGWGAFFTRFFSTKVPRGRNHT